MAESQTTRPEPLPHHETEVETGTGSPVAVGGSPTQTTKSSAYIKDELLLAMASILYEIAPPDGQKTIARLMDQLHAKQQEEEYQRFYGPHEEPYAW